MVPPACPLDRSRSRVVRTVHDFDLRNVLASGGGTRAERSDKPPESWHRQSPDQDLTILARSKEPNGRVDDHGTPSISERSWRWQGRHPARHEHPPRNNEYRRWVDQAAPAPKQRSLAISRLIAVAHTTVRNQVVAVPAVRKAQATPTPASSIQDGCDGSALRRPRGTTDRHPRRRWTTRGRTSGTAPRHGNRGKPNDRPGPGSGEPSACGESGNDARFPPPDPTLPMSGSTSCPLVPPWEWITPDEHLSVIGGASPARPDPSFDHGRRIGHRHGLAAAPRISDRRRHVVVVDGGRGTPRGTFSG
jgi:hypothetical protein